MAEYRRCYECGASYPEAADGTDPTDREVTLDSAGYVKRNVWVCGGCLERAQEANAYDPANHPLE